MALTQSNSHKFESGELVTATKLNNVKVVQTDTATNNNSFTGSAGQLTYDTTNNKLLVHDGTTAGGNEVGAGAGGSGSVSFDTDAYTPVVSSITSISSNPTTLRLFTIKTGRIRYICWDLFFGNNGAYPTITRANSNANIAIVLSPPTGKSWDIYNFGDITSDVGDGSHYPHGHMRYATWDSQQMNNYQSNKTNGYVSLSTTNAEELVIFLDHSNDGKVLQMIQGSISFPTTS
jgi:hypothetical protein